MYSIISSKQLPIKGEPRKQRVVVLFSEGDPGEPDAFAEEKSWGRWHRQRISQLRTDVLTPIAKQYSLVLEGTHKVTKAKRPENMGLTFDTGPSWADWLVRRGHGVFDGGFLLPTYGVFDVEVTVKGSTTVARSAVVLADFVRREYVAYQTTPELGALGKWSEPKTEVVCHKQLSRIRYLLIGEFHYPSNEVYEVELVKPAAVPLPAPAVPAEPAPSKSKPKLVVKK